MVVSPQAARSSARARKSRRSTSFPPARRLRMVSSARARTVLPCTAGSASNFSRAHSNMSRLTTVVGRKLPRSTRTAFLRRISLGWSTSLSGPNMATPLSPNCTSCKATSRLSTLRNSMPRNRMRSISIRSVLNRSSRLSTNFSGSWCSKKAPWSRFTPTIPSASCCSAASTSSRRTCRTTWLGSSCGCAWNLTPIHPWHSLPPRKLRATTVSAKAKNEVLSPRRSPSRSMLRAYSWSSIACSRASET